MAKQDVNIGVEGNDGTGDSIRESFRKVNENFQELYAVFGQGGQISFTTLGDTPATIEPGKIITTNTTGTAIIYSTIGSDSDVGSGNDSITVDTTSVPGKIILSTTFSAIVDDNVSPTLGGHLDASNFAIAGVQITEAAATALNSQPNRTTNYTIDDLVITRGYADRRYITSGLPVRIAPEPTTTSQYQLTIESYVSGNLFISGHGYDSGANGTAFIFVAEDTDPTNLTSGSTYYIRYVTEDQIALYATKEQAQTESPAEAIANKISVSGTIAADDVHTITDAGYDSTLQGNFLADVGMPRESIVRRQGDDMTGKLFLSDHPGDLAGDGTPNGPEDLQAATKYYVDNTAYSSPEVLNVSTIGDDTMQGVPNGKEGTSPTYAFRTINAAARRAEELIKTAPEEPGPYFQTLGYQSGGTTVNSRVDTQGVEDAANPFTSQTLKLNKRFLVAEVSGYLKFNYPNFSYNVDTCERDLGLIIDALRIDVNRGTTANYLSRTAAERYYSSVSGRLAITTQLKQTKEAFSFLGQLITEAVLQNKKYQEKTLLDNSSGLTKKSGDSPAIATTTSDHGLQNGNIVEFFNVGGMTEINGQFAYAKVIDSTSFELFADEALTVAFDNSTYGNYASVGNISLRYQTKFAQDATGTLVWDGVSGGVEPNAPSAITTNVALINNIIENGIDAGADVVYGSRYFITIDNNTSGFIDQTNPDNIDALPGKVIRGKRSGAIGRIITFEQTTNETTFFMQLLEPKEFDATQGNATAAPGEELELGNFVKAKQVTIRVESGIYEEDYPIRLPNNVSLKGDEFRRVIVKPKQRASQSKWAQTYFYRDKEFDGIELYNSGTPFYNQVGTLQGYFGFHYLNDNTRQINVGPTVSNLGKYVKAAQILKSNKEFIQDEVIAFIAATYQNTGFTYDEAKCRRDSEIILNGSGYDIALGTNYNSVTNGLAYQRANSSYVISNQQTATVQAIQFLRDGAQSLANAASGGDGTADTRLLAYFNEIVDIIQNGIVSTETAADVLDFPAPSVLPTADADDAAIRLQNNRVFLAAEALAYIALNYSGLTFDSAKCSRDVKYIVDALTYDVLYGGNSASRTAAESYFVGAASQLGSGEALATAAVYAHLASVASNIVQGVSVTPTSGNAESVDTSGNNATATEGTKVEDLFQIIEDVITAGDTLGLPIETLPSVTWSAAALQNAKAGIDAGTSTLISQTISFINDNFLGFSYNEEKCRRDTGYIIDGLVKDLIRGGQEFALENQGQYYAGYVSAGFGGQEDETAAAIGHISTLAGELLLGIAPSISAGTAYTPDVSLGKVEPDWATGVAYIQNDFVKRGSKYYRSLVKHTSKAEDEIVDPVTLTLVLNPDIWLETTASIALVGQLIDIIQYPLEAATKDLYNPPLRNDQMDVFLMDDATIVRNLTIQGHGGFMCVLDPDGQVLTKSPYIQTATSFSKSENKKAFRGGMYVDAYAGNIPIRVLANSGSSTTVGVSGGAVTLDAFKIAVESLDVGGEPQGLKLRLPQLPAPFYYQGQRYQVNAISNYDSGTGKAIIYLDPNSNGGSGWDNTGTDLPGDPGFDQNDVVQDIFLQTAGNRSILGNDFTQINDLAYGLVTNNGAFSEMVSMFTYYTHAAYYAANGSEIRSLNGSNGYGNFGLVAEGADPNEIPDQVTLLRDTVEPVKSFTFGSFTNASADTSLTAYDFREAPLRNATIYINHPTAGPLNYKITNIQNLSTPNNDGVVGAGGAPVVTGVNTLDTTIGGGNGYTGTPPSVTGIYNNVVQKSTSGSGTGFKLNVTMSAGTPTITIGNSGQGYAAGDTITISGANIGGTDVTNDLTVQVLATWQTTPGTFSNEVYRLTIQEAGSNTDFYPDLQEGLAHDSIIEYRHGETIIFEGVENQSITERPSTAVNFDESDLVTYRSTGFTTTDDQGTALSSTQIKAVFDTDFKYVTVELDPSGRNTSAALVGGSGTMGASTTDQYLSVKQLSDADAIRLLQDATDTVNQTVLNPNDVGWTGGMIFTYGSRVLQAIEYGPVTFGNIQSISLGSTITITSSAHGLINGQAVEFKDIDGTIELNNTVKYVGNVSTNTFDLYEDDTLSTLVDGTNYTAHVAPSGQWIRTDSIWYVKVNALTANDVTGNTNNDIGTVNDSARNVYAGLINGTTAEITVAISLLRATGHDFTEIGTGGFNTTNYPNVLLGEPIGGAASKAGAYTDADNATSSQVWERRKGRVFFISSDNDGYFRVGKYFVVDQSTGSITFAGEVGISRAASLGFKEGVTIDEFSNDELFTDLSDTAVPTEKAIANYVSRRLGHNGTAQLTGSNRFSPGFMALNGSTGMEGNLDMGSKQIKNLLDPVDPNDATTKDFVDQAVSAYDELDDLRNVVIHPVTAGNTYKQLFVPTGARKLIVEPEAGVLFDPTAANKTITGSGLSAGASGTLIARDAKFDKVLNQNIVVLTYTPGATDFVGGGVVTQPDNGASSAVVEAPVDEYANAVESTTSDINITVTRTATNTEVNLQIEPDSIINTDVKSNAAIAQSKLAMNAATTRANATGIAQADLGLASFDSSDFTVTNGWVTLKANDVDFADLPTLATDTVIGRSAAGSGNSSAIPFSTIIDEGLGIADGDFTTVLAYGSPVNDPGQAMIKTGAGTYRLSEISYDNENTSIAKRRSDGSLQATSFIVGGTSTNVVLSESSNTLSFTTPEGGTILTALGASKPTINTGGAIKVGDIANVTESSFHQNSPYGSVGGAGTTQETSALAARWIYSSFIEAPNEKNSTGTGIGLGSNTGFAAGGADVITFVTGGNVEAKVTTTGIETDDIRSTTANTNLTISANGTGTVYVNDTMTVTGQITGTINNADNINVDEKNDNVNYQMLFSAANGSGYQRPYIDTDNGHLLYNPSTHTMTVGAITSVTSISTGAATTTGTITGRWSLTTNSRFEATYADLAEYYEGDREYEIGTVLVFGGDKEVTESATHRTTRVAGVVSDQSAYIMNSGCQGIKTCVALQGRVPVKVIGAVAKGDMLVASSIPGYACVDNDPKVGTVIGKAVGTKTDGDRGMVEAVVGRV